MNRARPSKGSGSGLAGLLLLACHFGGAQTLPLPERPANAVSGTQFAKRVATLSLAEREREVYSQIMAGNVPDFLRKLCAVQITNIVAGHAHTATFYAMADYLAIGSDKDYLLMPISPDTAQRVADALNCSLPTPKMVNDIYAAAAVKLAPCPIFPSAAMVTVPVFSNHNAMVWSQRMAQLDNHPLGALTAGHKKDVVITARLTAAPGKVAIYGWHKTNGAPIQPLYLKHTATWVDYSQCTRLVQQRLILDGQTRSVAEVLAEPALCGVLSDEGVVECPRYSTNVLSSAATLRSRSEVRSPKSEVLTNQSKVIQAAEPGTDTFAGFQTTNRYQERIASFTFNPEVKIQINAPAQGTFDPGKKVLLVFYCLPNGNTTEQTIGKTLAPGDDWHYDIQHIGAQTRFLREVLPNYALVVAYLEAGQKSWPAWRLAHGDSLIPQIVSRVEGLFAGTGVEIVLSGHSGGGSFIFGFLNAVERIPGDVIRVAFLDSNYAYNQALGHKDKLVEWLEADPARHLCVLAYNDAVALLEGKPFVSAAGGTWGKSHEMQRDLAEAFSFTSRTNSGLEEHVALDRRVQFLLQENPERKILHTVQVERNGFIHCLLCGTANEGKGYEYFGPRAYAKWIEGETPNTKPQTPEKLRDSNSK